jgi:protein TonB
MFEDSLFATNARPAPQRGMAAAISFSIQAVLLGVLVLVPLIYTDALPLGAIRTYVEIPLPPGPPPAPPPAAAHQPRPQQSSNMQDNVLVLPPAIPKHAATIVEDTAPQITGGPYVPGSTGGGTSRGPLNDILLASNMRPAPPAPAPNTKPRVVRISRLDEGLLLHRVSPSYPALARQARIQGAVVMRAMVGRDGSIQGLQVLSGHPMLTQAAIDAVKQWRYRPYLLNNEPVEVETQITVNFVLGG